MTAMSDKPLLSLRVRLAALVLIVITPIVALVLINHVGHSRHDVEHAGANALHLARLASEHHEGLVAGARQMLASLARLPEVRNADLPRCDAILDQIVRDDPRYGSVVLVNGDGDIISPAAAATRKLNVSDQLWFQPVRDARGFTVGGYQWGRVSNEMVLICAQPLLDARGEPRGVLAASLRTDWLERYARAASLPAGSTFTIVGRDGMVWARYPDGARWVGKTAPDAGVVREVAEAGAAEATNVDGDVRICAYAPLSVSSANSAGGASQLYVLVSLPRDAVVARANAQLATKLGALAVVTLAMLAVATLASRLWILRWMDRLAAATRRLAAGDLSARAGLTGGPLEFQRLGASFDEMAAAVEQSALRRDDAERSLRRSHDLLGAVVAFVSEAMFIKDLQGRYLLLNAAGAQMLGRTVDDTVGKSDVELFPPDVVTEIRRQDREVVEKGESHTWEDAYVINGSLRHFVTSKAPYRDGDGTIVGLLGIARDVTASKEAEQALRRSEQHLRNVLDSLFTFVAVLTPDGVLSEVNEVALRAVAADARDVLGKPFDQTAWWAHSPYERARLLDTVARAARGEGSRYETSPRVDEDGRPIFVDTMIAPMSDEHGRVTHIIVSGIDVTQKRRAEEALRESEQRLSLALRAAGLGTWDDDVRTGEALWSEQTFRLLGYEPPAGGRGGGGGGGAASREMWRSRVHPDDLKRVSAAATTAMRDRSLYNPEYRIIRGNGDGSDGGGEIAWVSSAGRFVYDEQGRPVRFIGVMQDVTARKRAEEEIARLNLDLQRRVEELQTLLEVLPVGIGIAHDPAGARIDANSAFGRVLGLSSGANASLGAPPGERPDNFTCWAGGRELSADELPLQIAARTGAVVRDVEIEVRHRDGRVIHLLEYAAPLLDADGATRGSVGAFIDISERKRADAERQALMERAGAERTKLEAVLRQLPAGVLITQAVHAEPAWGRIVLRNEQVARILRLGDEPREQPFEPIGFHPDGRRYEPHEWPLARSLARGERVTGEEIEIVRGDGTRGHISINAGPILDAAGSIVAAVATFYDITERRQAQSVARRQQAELIHLSRLSTMGQMAAGLAHELNQPLGAILNYAGVCLDRVSAQERCDAKVVAALEEIAGETKRAGEIIRRLRGFARKEKPNVAPRAINHLVREAVAMVSTELHYTGVRVEYDLSASLPDVLADGVQIEQVLVNLLRNAIDAMRDTEPALRRLAVRTEAVDDAARVSVIDAGCGIAPDVRARIFDSFFTTKPDGLGMGLPICQSIIQGHGGNLGVASKTADDDNGNGNGGGGGGGTVVHFTLPLVQQRELVRS